MLVALEARSSSAAGNSERSSAWKAGEWLTLLALNAVRGIALCGVYSSRLRENASSWGTWFDC